MAILHGFLCEQTEPAVVIEHGDIFIKAGGRCDIWIRMNSDEAVKLRDDLHRAIVDAAQQHAQATAKAADAEGAQA